MTALNQPPPTVGPLARRVTPPGSPWSDSKAKASLTVKDDKHVASACGALGYRFPMGAGHLPKDQAQRVVEAVRTLLETLKTNAAVGKALGRSAASVGEWLAAQPKSQPSMETARRVAVLIGVDPADLLAGTATLPEPDEYVERASAISRLRSMLTPDVIAAVREIVPPRRFSEREWIRIALREQDEADQERALREQAPSPPRTRTH